MKELIEELFTELKVEELVLASDNLVGDMAYIDMLAVLDNYTIFLDANDNNTKTGRIRIVKNR